MQKMKEFSKRVVIALIILWFLGALFGSAVIVIQLVRDSYTVSIDALLTYIGTPMGGGIVGYMLKSAFENREKIKHGFHDISDHTEF